MAAVDMLDASLEDPTAYITAGWATAGLGLAAYCHRQGYRPMCSTIRTPLGLACLALFLAHLAHLLGPLDPINAVSRKIPQRRAT